MRSTRFDTQDSEFDIEVQRFLVNRWETPIGQVVRERVIDGIKNSVEIRAILDDYILDHPENGEPYGYPVYPRDCLSIDKFWVLHPDDLRGIHFYNEDFQGSSSLEVKMFDYAHFYNCNFDSANLERCSFTRALFEQCNFTSSVLAAAGGFYTTFLNCPMQSACFWQAAFIESTFQGCDLRGAYFEGALMEGLIVDYRTNFGQKVNKTWKTRRIKSNELPDICKFIRRAYEGAEIFQVADFYLYRERTARRKHILFPNAMSPKPFLEYLSDAIRGFTIGYGTKPFRILWLGPLIAFAFASFYYLEGTPFSSRSTPSNFAEYLYFSLTSFATLGFGDLAFGQDHPLLRLLSASEALVGAGWVAVFIAVLSRRLMR
jgi:hypothetical protein